MGEAFKRARAEAFAHRRGIHYQMALDGDLITMARDTETQYELNTRLLETAGELPIGSQCLVMPAANGKHQLVFGNKIVSELSPSAAEVVRAISVRAPSLSGLVPCRVVRTDGFGGVTLKPDPGDSSDG